MSCLIDVLDVAAGALETGAVATCLGAGGGALEANSALAFSTNGCNIVIDVGYKQNFQGTII